MVHWQLTLATTLLLSSGSLLRVQATLVDDIVLALEKAVDCASCHALLIPLKSLASLGNDAFVSVLTTICTESGAEDPDVCSGIVSAEGPIIAHDLRQISPTGETATKLCDALFGLCDPPPVIPFQFPLPRTTKAPTFVSKGREPFQVIHISDVHIDRQYTVGAEANCTKNICCRDFADSSPNVSIPAEPFGNSRCDSPIPLADSMLGAINDLGNGVKFTIFTGDVVEGAIWLVDKAEVTDDLMAFNSELAAQLRIPIFPAIGNHDAAPVNSFPRNSTATTLDSQWVFDTQSVGWARWINKTAAHQVAHVSGSYAVVAPGTNLRIISINTQYWYKQNFWLYDSDSPQPDPNGILSFLAQQLQIAEDIGQRAWIIGHIPLGKEDTMSDQSNYYDQIVQRYHRTIAGQFFGHSHKDQFQITYSDYNNPSAGNAVSVALIAPALTPTSGNPAFKVYDVDPETYEIMDARVIFANISDPGFQSAPIWSLYYSARATYGPLVGLSSIQPLSPSFWHTLTEVFVRNDTAFQLFNTFQSRGGAVSPCDTTCKNISICDMRAFRAENNCDNPSPGAPFRRSVQEQATTQDFMGCGGVGVKYLLSKLIGRNLMQS